MRATTVRRVAERVVLPKLEQDILRVILYFDIFAHPVSVEEIHTFLPSRVSSRTSIEHALESLQRKSLLRMQRRYYFLSSASDRCVGERMEKQNGSAKERA